MPGSSEPHHGDTSESCPGGKSRSALLCAGSRGRCWEEIHDAEAAEHHPGWKSYKETAWPSHQAGLLGLQELGVKEHEENPEPIQGKAGATSIWQGETSEEGTLEEDAGRLPAEAAERGCPEGAKAPSGDGGCGGVCTLPAHVATLPRVFNPESGVNPATEPLQHGGKRKINKATSPLRAQRRSVNPRHGGIGARGGIQALHTSQDQTWCQLSRIMPRALKSTR